MNCISVSFIFYCTAFSENFRIAFRRKCIKRIKASIKACYVFHKFQRKMYQIPRFQTTSRKEILLIHKVGTHLAI